MEQEKVRELVNKQPSEEQQKTIREFQTIFSEFKNEIKTTAPEKTQEILNKEDFTKLFESFGRDLRDNQKESHIHDNENTKINLERVYNYILQKCTIKDPNFIQKIQDHKKTYLTEETLSWQSLYYKKLMILNIYLTEHFWVFFAYNTRHLAYTPNPILEAEKKQVPKDKQIKIQESMQWFGFESDQQPIEYILVKGKFPDTNFQWVYIANTIFAFDQTWGDDIQQSIIHEYVHQCFDKKYGNHIWLQEIIKNGEKEYRIGYISDGIFKNESRYTATGLSIQEFLADAIEMDLSKGGNQIDLRHKAYNLNEHKTCPIKYRNSIWLMTYLINNTPELRDIYEKYTDTIKHLGEKKADQLLKEKLETTKIQEKSCQEYITQKYVTKTQEIIRIVETIRTSKGKK